VGTLTDGTVTLSNGDNTDVVLWTYSLIYVPPGSAIPLSTSGATASPTWSFAQPDVPGCYRVRLVVQDGSGNTDTDIRNFIVPCTYGTIIPPYQGIPTPLPLTGTGSKPDELNIGGQSFGWSGDGSYSLLHANLARLDWLLGAYSVGARYKAGVIDTDSGTPDITTDLFTITGSYAAGRINLTVLAATGTGVAVPFSFSMGFGYSTGGGLTWIGGGGGPVPPLPYAELTNTGATVQMIVHGSTVDTQWVYAADWLMSEVTT